MSSNRAILLRYHEIALKGLNRKWFENCLAENARKLIQRELGTGTKIGIHRQRGRILLEAPWTPATQKALNRLFGANSYSPMRKVPTDRSEISKAALEEFSAFVKTSGLPKNFRVLSRRSDKVFSETSMEIDAWIGTQIQEAFPSVSVELKKPEMILGVEVHFKETFIWTEKSKGLGGLPVGTNGHVLTLLSGGLDSPIAALHLIKRGASSSFIHFYGTPFVGPEILEKIEELTLKLNHYQPDPMPLYIVPFGKIQEQIALASHPRTRTILYRRMMIRVACRFANKIGAKALVTGESLGQVASQTLENLSTINACATLPILRPLIGLDKDEIVLAAEKWGTFETSVKAAPDCCTLFADRHPATRSTPGSAEKEEAGFSINTLVDQALESTFQFSSKAQL